MQKFVSRFTSKGADLGANDKLDVIHKMISEHIYLLEDRFNLIQFGT